MKIDYNRIAENYSRYRDGDTGIIKNIFRSCPLNRESTVLEIGCGTGNYITNIYHSASCKCFGVDPSKEMLSAAGMKNADVDYTEGYAESLRFNNDFFDLVFSVDTIHHLKDYLRYFKEAFRVLKTGGLLATFTDSEDTIRRREPLSVYFPDIIEIELKRYPSVSKIKDLSEQAGFKVLSEEIVETTYVLNEIEKYKNKAFSCLRLIPEEAFQNGIRKMEDALKKNGNIISISRNYVIWSKKGI